MRHRNSSIEASSDMTSSSPETEIAEYTWLNMNYEKWETFKREKLLGVWLSLVHTAARVSVRLLAVVLLTRAWSVRWCGMHSSGRTACDHDMWCFNNASVSSHKSPAHDDQTTREVLVRYSRQRDVAGHGSNRRRCVILHPSIHLSIHPSIQTTVVIPHNV